MATSLNQQSPVAQQTGSVLAGLQMLVSVLSWLAGYVQLTEEEQREAGIYLGD
ncbi:MAG: hypothetical protein PHQ36_04730 [Anaerolineales bacterium]|nr:hypothetical protein [Anaerolineales bacterium]